MKRREFVAGSVAMGVSVTTSLSAQVFPHHTGVPMKNHDFEVAIVGGGPAGLSAALTLGRSGRRALLLDAGSPRNAPAHAAHNFFTRDGTPPAELLRIGHEQLRPYPSVEVRTRGATTVQRHPDGGFEITDDANTRTTATYVVLCTGVIDELPAVKGLREVWGTGAFHCPYCHGWEVRGEPFLVVAQSERAAHLGRILTGWSRSITLCPVDGLALDSAERDALSTAGVTIIDDPVAELVSDAAGRVSRVVLEGGRELGAHAVFVDSRMQQRSPIPAALGCTILREGMFAGLVETDPLGFTGVEGVYVAGDASIGMPSIVHAAAEGATVGAIINNEMLMAGRTPRDL